MDQVKKMVIACIISRKGGVPITEIDNEYRQLVGTKVPYAKYGFPSIEAFIESIAEIMMVHNLDGSIILKARDTKTSHIASLVDGQKTTGNARKKGKNGYRMSAAGQNYIRGASRYQNYGNSRSDNYKTMERIAPESVTQGDYKIASHRKQEMGRRHTVHSESVFQHATENEMTQGIKTRTEKYFLNSAHEENELHRSQTRQPLKLNTRHFQQKNSTDYVPELDDCYEEFDRSQVKARNQRRISVDGTILVTIVNNYYQSSSYADRIRQRRRLLSDWGPDEEDETCGCSNHHHHQGYSKEISTVRQKYRMNPSRRGEPVDYYEELYVKKKWVEDGDVNDCAENVSGYYMREDSDYTRYRRDISRNELGLLIKVKNEYADDRHILTAI